MEGCFMFQWGGGGGGGVQIGFFTFKCGGCPMGRGAFKKNRKMGDAPMPPPLWET